MNDILPSESVVWQQIEQACKQIFEQFSYREIRTPLVEATQLFARSIGEQTDIVAKEMYTFADRNNDSLSLRPEGTASTVRAGIQNGLFHNQQQRLWYLGPMFRYERPQKGRYRQFHQVGVECYGWADADIEAEVFSMSKILFDRLGLTNTQLQINSLGDQASRAAFRASLVGYLSDHRTDLDEDSQRRLDSNPLRILDSKNSDTQAILDNAPSILDYLSPQSQTRFEQLQGFLRELGIPYQLNSRLVRGLDYYNDTVFEWINADYGAQATVCGGGRYDAMVEQLGGQATPAFGFGMGLERLIQMLQEQAAASVDIEQNPEVFIVSNGDAARQQALGLQAHLVRAGCRVQCHMGVGSFKNQFKKADKSGASLALIIGEDEARDGLAGIKILRKQADGANSEQQTISQNELVDVVTNLLKTL